MTEYTPASMAEQRPPRPAEQPAERFNPAASWVTMTLRDRYKLCKLAGFPKPFDVADKRFHQLTEGELQILADTVRAHLYDVPSSAWGLAS